MLALSLTGLAPLTATDCDGALSMAEQLVVPGVQELFASLSVVVMVTDGVAVVSHCVAGAG